MGHNNNNKEVTMRAMRSWWMVGALFVVCVAAGCGGTSSGQTCTEKHACVNGACTCSEGPKKDSSCCDPNTDNTCTSGSSNDCTVFCKVCS